MAQVYFHCTNTHGALLDRRGAAVDDFAEAHEHAALVMQALISAPSMEDWRDWVLHVSDELGDEILAVQFASMLGKPH